MPKRRSKGRTWTLAPQIVVEALVDWLPVGAGDGPQVIQERREAFDYRLLTVLTQQFSFDCVANGLGE